MAREISGILVILEQVYSVALERGNLSNLSPDELLDIEEAIRGLELLVGYLD